MAEPVAEPLVAGYLDRLGLPHDLPPTIETLVLLQRRHVDRVPYDNLEIMLGRPPSAEPLACLARVVTTGRAGYCFHHNGALEVVLRALGFDVRRRHGHVWTQAQHRDDPELTHLVLEVAGLPTAANPGGRWWPDVALGDAFLDPLPLVAGEHVQEPFRYRLVDVHAHGWSFVHDPSGSFAGVEVCDRAVDQVAVEEAHAHMSTPPGAFTRKLVVQRRQPGRCTTLRGVLLVEVDAAGRHETALTAYDVWRAALTGPLGLPVDDLDDLELRGLHGRSVVAHTAWEEAGRP